MRRKRYLNQVKVALLIQVLNSIVKGILIVALPLMMKDRNIDIVTIGLIFASMPIIMQLGRIFFATISDFWGRKLFFFLNGLLGVISSSIYYLAYTPLVFLFGKISEGTKNGFLWAVNRAFLMENSERKRTVLVRMKTATYVSEALGTLLAGFFLAWLLCEGTLALCALFGALVVPLSLLLVGGRKEKLNMTKALHFLDFREKERIFKIFLILFFVMGLSSGPPLIRGFLIPLFLDSSGFNAETIGVLLGLQILLAALVSYLFAKRVKTRRVMLISGILCTTTLISLGFSSSVFSGILVIFYGVVEGLRAIVHEGILAKITDKESYGTDIGLLMMGFHSGSALSIATSGALISMFGFAAPFLTAASIFPLFYLTSYLVLKE
jgi:MFS family permease